MKDSQLPLLWMTAGVGIYTILGQLSSVSITDMAQLVFALARLWHGWPGK